MNIPKYEVQEGNKTISIVIDEHPQSPREDYKPLGKLIGWHRKYDVCDVKAENTEMYTSWKEWADNELPKNIVALPVYMYDHGGITLSTGAFNCQWDSGQLGFIYVKKEDLRKEYEVKRVSQKLVEDVERVLEREIELYSVYLSETSYGIEFKENGWLVESSWGYYGYKSDEEMVKEMLDNIPEGYGSLSESILELVK